MLISEGVVHGTGVYSARGESVGPCLGEVPDIKKKKKKEKGIDVDGEGPFTVIDEI
jgi:hypothetical protein